MKRIFISLFSYNRPDGVIDRIEEIKNQTYTDWRLYIFDDCSKQENLTIIKKYLENNPNENINLICNKENNRLPKQINKSISVFRETEDCDFFTWISDDNYYLPYFLEYLMEPIPVLKRLGDDRMIFSYTGYEYMKYDENNILVKHKIYLHKYTSFCNLKKKFYGLVCFMWSKKLIKKIGFYDEEMFGIEDLDYLYRTFLNTYQSERYYNSKSGCVYVDHSKNITNKEKDIINESLIKFENKYKNISFNR